MVKFRFQDLKIWQLAIEIADKLFDIADELEKKRLYRFADQLRGAGLKDEDFYTGFTENLKLRFEQHNKGLVESTKDRRPFRLIYYEVYPVKCRAYLIGACLDPNDATKREKYLKTFHGKMFLKRRLKSYLTG